MFARSVGKLIEHLCDCAIRNAVGKLLYRVLCEAPSAENGITDVCR